MFSSSMHVYLALLQLLPSLVTATNGSCLHISNIDTNPLHYKIPESNPSLTLSFDQVLPPEMDPSIVLLSIIENMQPICRHFRAAFPPLRVFDYALVRTTFRSFPCGSLTYNDVCTVLRGLAEFMTLQNQFYQWRFQIWVNGYNWGSGEIELVRMLPAASAAGVGTS